MRKNIISSSEFKKNGVRLDCGPYVNESYIIKNLLNQTLLRKERLVNLTLAGIDGIFKAPRLSPKYVVDDKLGVKYLSSSEILEKDYLDVKSINASQAEANNFYKVKYGMTLITSSGTIGRTAFAGKDIGGWMGSPHFMRVMPDNKKIPEGYLYAFLSSKYGHAQIKEGVYGSIIVAIEPSHISELLVPRLGSLEMQISELIISASNKRSMANRILKDAILRYESAHNLEKLERLTSGYSFSISDASSKMLQKRFDARFHNKYHQDAIKKCIDSGFCFKVSELSKLVFEPNRFKRIPADNGIKLFGTTAIFQNTPDYNCYISRKIKNVDQYIVTNNTLLISRSGQLNGIIGNVEVPTGALLNQAVSEDAIRVELNTELDFGYVFVALSSEYSRRQLKSRSFGTSIPHLDVKSIENILILKKDNNIFSECGKMGLDVFKLRNQAYDIEMKAIKLLEETIDAAVPKN